MVEAVLVVNLVAVQVVEIVIVVVVVVLLLSSSSSGYSSGNVG